MGICHADLNPSHIPLSRSAANLFSIPSSPPAGGRDDGDSDLYRPTEASNSRPDPAQADVFALGVIWYQLLVDRIDRPPYDFADVLRAAGEDSHTIAMISRCLASPDRRFADAVELEREFTGASPPRWPPVPKGCVDVSQIVREYLTAVG